MRIIETKAYQFGELSEKAKEKAIEWGAYLNVVHEWWDHLYDDAEGVGLKITGFDIDRGARCDINITTSAPEVIEAILANHGKDCDTYKTAKEFKPKFDALQVDRDNEKESFEDDFEALEKEFLHAMSEEYLSILRKEYEYLTSEEAIRETIEANEYEFTEEGKRI